MLTHTIQFLACVTPVQAPVTAYPAINRSIQGDDRAFLINAMAGLPPEKCKDLTIVDFDGTVHAIRPELKDQVTILHQVDANLWHNDFTGEDQAVPSSHDFNSDEHIADPMSPAGNDIPPHTSATKLFSKYLDIRVITRAVYPMKQGPGTFPGIGPSRRVFKDPHGKPFYGNNYIYNVALGTLILPKSADLSPKQTSQINPTWISMSVVTTTNVFANSEVVTIDTSR